MRTKPYLILKGVQLGYLKLNIEITSSAARDLNTLARLLGSFDSAH